MLHHGGTSSKPTIFWGNLSTMGDLNRGRLTQEERVAKTTVSTTRSLVATVIAIYANLYACQTITMSNDIIAIHI